MLDVITTIAELVGAVLIITGLAMVSIPAALIVAGVMLIAASFLVVTR